MNTSKYFFQTLIVVIVSGLSFLAFKTFLPKKLFAESKLDSKNVVVDSLLLEAIAEDEDATVEDSMAKTVIDYKVVNGIQFPPETFEEYTGNQYLATFFEKLFQLETKKEGNVRIAYFGDSMTDGDLIVKDFRTYLQEKFGGQGVGFVNITSESAASRSSITHEFSGNWKTQSYLKVKRPSNPFGVNGHVFYANDTANVAWVKYKANKTRFASELPHPTLFYGRSSNKDGKIKYVIGTDTISKKLTPNALVNTVVLSESNLKSIKVNFKKADSIPIYGFNFDDGKGVHVDNFSNRGNSGLPIGSFDVATMRAFHSKLDYDLIVLQYGANVLNSLLPDGSSLDWLEGSDNLTATLSIDPEQLFLLLQAMLALGLRSEAGRRLQFRVVLDCSAPTTLRLQLNCDGNGLPRHLSRQLAEGKLTDLQWRDADIALLQLLSQKVQAECKVESLDGLGLSLNVNWPLSCESLASENSPFKEALS